MGRPVGGLQSTDVSMNFKSYIPYYAMQNYMTIYYTILFSTSLHYPQLYSTTLYYTVLCYTVALLHYTMVRWARFCEACGAQQQGAGASNTNA